MLVHGWLGRDVTREQRTIDVGGTQRHAIHLRQCRFRGREVQPDAAGALLKIVLPEPIDGPLAIGYGSNLSAGLFAADDAGRRQVRSAK